MENGGAPQQGEGKDPSGFLGEIINSAVTVKLNSGVVYKGACTALYQSSSTPSSVVRVPEPIPYPPSLCHDSTHPTLALPTQFYLPKADNPPKAPSSPSTAT